MESFTITKIRGNNREKLEDMVTKEVPLTLMIGDKELVTLLCSPLDLEDLVRGFLFTSGFIKNVSEIKKIVLNEQQWVVYIDILGRIDKDLVFKRLYTSGCGRGTLFYNAHDVMYRSKIVSLLRIKSHDLNRLMRAFQKRSHLYLKTGGVHSAALTDGKDILVSREDIGRHNAIDKVIGYMMAQKNSFENKILMTSGRISSEVLFKVRKCNIPIVISRSAPTNQAVKLSREMGITLVGFARANRINIYSGEDRIVT